MIRSYATADEKCLFVVRGHVSMPNNSEDYYSGWDKIRIYLAGEAEKAGLNSRKYKELFGSFMFAHYFTKSQWQLISKKDYEKIQELFKDKGYFTKDWEELKREHIKIKKEYDKLKEDNLSYFNNTHDNMNNVWHFDRTSGKEKDDAEGHATPKPLSLVARGIKSSSKENDVVLDVFGGSGTTLVVCEQLNRQARLMELEPHWADVIIARWEKMTGGEAELVE